VQNIEQGRRQIDSTSVILELADALGVEPNKLVSRPLFSPPKSADMPRPREVLRDLRRVLLHYDGIHGADPAEDRPPRPAAELERQVQLAGEIRRTQANNISAVIWILPDLIQGARHAARNAGEATAARRVAWQVLARSYSLAAALLWQYGDDELGWVAADRSIHAAEQADDALLVAAGARVMQQLLLAQGDMGSVIEMSESAGNLIVPGRDAPPEQLVIWGNLQLFGAFAAARAKNGREHARLRDLSEYAAERLGEDRLYLGFNFGPGDVALQHVGELVELEQPSKALRLAEQMPDDPLPPGGPPRLPPDPQGQGAVPAAPRPGDRRPAHGRLGDRAGSRSVRADDLRDDPGHAGASPLPGQPELADPRRAHGIYLILRKRRRAVVLAFLGAD